MPNTKSVKSLLEKIPGYQKKLLSLREIILANAVMIGEHQAETFNESDRIDFLSDRFTECGLLNISIDEVGNAIAILPGKNKDKNILVAAHADTVFKKTVDHTVMVEPNFIIGPGIADNSLGLSILGVLPVILEKLDIQFTSNIIFLGTVQSLGRGELKGIRFFLDNFNKPIDSAICVEGVHLGRLSYKSLGMLRGEITCHATRESEWDDFDSKGIIPDLIKIISEISRIPIPEKPKTSIILGSVEAGTSYNTAPLSSNLRFEIRSEKDKMVREIQKRIEEIVDDAAIATGSKIVFDIIARISPGGLNDNHPLVINTKHLMRSLGIDSKITPSVGLLSALINKGIPGITLGLTKGSNLHELNESIKIDPIFKGLAQLIGIMQLADLEN